MTLLKMVGISDEEERELSDQLRRDYGNAVQPMSLEQARRFAQIDAEEYVADVVNYHKNIIQCMFWSGVSNEEIDRYINSL